MKDSNFWFFSHHQDKREHICCIEMVLIIPKSSNFPTHLTQVIRKLQIWSYVVCRLPWFKVVPTKFWRAQAFDKIKLQFDYHYSIHVIYGLINTCSNRYILHSMYDRLGLGIARAGSPKNCGRWSQTYLPSRCSNSHIQSPIKFQCWNGWQTFYPAKHNAYS